MSSLKGQLANVEGSVKTMKMAVVVGSVLTVACLAAVFGVTILANEVSKETKVSNGALVTRNGATVATATMTKSTLAAQLLAKTLKVGDVMDFHIEGGSMECAIEKVVYKSTAVVAFCDEIAVVADAESINEVTTFTTENSMFKQISGEALPTFTQEEVEAAMQSSRKTQWYQAGCFAIAMLNSSVGFGMALGGYLEGTTSAWELAWELIGLIRTATSSSMSPWACLNEIRKLPATISSMQ